MKWLSKPITPKKDWVERERARIDLNAIQKYSLKVGEETKFSLDNAHAGGVKPNL